MARYFKLEDQATFNAIQAHNARNAELRAQVVEWAESVGFGKPEFFRDGLFGQTLEGFKPTGTADAVRQVCTKPSRLRLIRPRASGRGHDKALLAAYRAQWAKSKTYDEPLEPLIGFNQLSFFPSFPGYKGDADYFVWVMPDRVTEVKGCVEITNIEFLELTQ